MINLKNTNNLNGKHLTDEEVAFCAQEMMAENYPEKIPQHLLVHLENCEECKKELLEFYQMIADEPAVKEATRQEQRRNDLEPEQKVKLKKTMHLFGTYRRIALVAASIILLAAIAGVIYINRPVSAEKLFSQYYEPYGDVVTAKSSPDQKILLNGLFHYNHADYDTAIALFISGLQSDPDNEDLRFYLGSSYLAQGSYHDAIISFSMLREKASKYYSPVGWYLALAYLANDQADEAGKMFELIRDEGGFYAENAARILNKLK